MKNIDEKTKNKIIRIINALIPEARIYLFGSRARGTHAKWSDIDLALDTGKRIPIATVDEIKSVLAETNIPFKMEVVDVHHVSDSMRDSIEQEKILWK